MRASSDLGFGNQQLAGPLRFSPACLGQGALYRPTRRFCLRPTSYNYRPPSLFFHLSFILRFQHSVSPLPYCALYPPQSPAVPAVLIIRSCMRHFDSAPLFAQSASRLLKQLARQGEPDLLNLRGVCITKHLLVSKLTMFL